MIRQIAAGRRLVELSLFIAWMSIVAIAICAGFAWILFQAGTILGSLGPAKSAYLVASVFVVRAIRWVIINL